VPGVRASARRPRNRYKEETKQFVKKNVENPDQFKLSFLNFRKDEGMLVTQARKEGKEEVGSLQA